MTLGGGAMGRGALAIEALGAGEPALGHPIPGRLARRVARELGHLLAIGSVAQEFLGWIHRIISSWSSDHVVGDFAFASFRRGQAWRGGEAARGMIRQPSPAECKSAAGGPVIEVFGDFCGQRACAGTRLIRIDGIIGARLNFDPPDVPLALPLA